MISDAEAKTVYSWATGKTDIKKILGYGDALKGTRKGRTLAIIAPSYLMRKIDYMSILKRKDIDTMGVNNCYRMPGCELLDFYLPFTTMHATRKQNAQADYLKWMQNYRGQVMHGIHFNDGTNSASPYLLAHPDEAKEIIAKCPNTKFMLWHHAWGDHVKRKGVPGMLEFPHFDQWTPRRIPWGHCGAVSGFAIPIAMALGYTKIFVVGMGYMYVRNGWHNPPKPGQKPLSQATARDPWVHVAKTRFPNQAAIAKKHGIELRVGPSLIESPLKTMFETFDSIGDIK